MPIENNFLIFISFLSMTEPKEAISFQEIPEKFNFKAMDISNDQIRKIYSFFSFKFYHFKNKEERFDLCLFDLLKQFDFIAYEILQMEHEINDIQKYYVIICVEKTCLFIETIYV